MIPARLGSKRIPKKNLRLLDGKPLVCHVADTAKQSQLFEDIYINSEADLFHEVARQYGVRYYHRPAELATDSATNDMFVLDFINTVSCDIIIQVNPTSPLITVDDIQGFVRTMIEGGYDTLHSVKQEQIEGVYRGVPLNYDPLKPMPRSQDLEPINLFCSAMMGWRVIPYRGWIERFGAATYGGDGKTGFYTLKGFSTIDIDNEEDFLAAELAIAFRKNPELVKPEYYRAPS